MKPDNTVCLARTIVTLDLVIDGQRGEQDALGLVRDLTAARDRLGRLEDLVRALARTVEDLRVRRTRDAIELSTYSADLAQVEAALLSAGARPEEYRVDVEYSRRWGLL